MTNRVWLVTVKIQKNPDHNPRDKKTGPCPVNGKPCTDVTGEHHTFVAFLPDLDAEGVREAYEGIYHVTRVEAAAL
jgi:hypothetical protein